MISYKEKQIVQWWKSQYVLNIYQLSIKNKFHNTDIFQSKQKFKTARCLSITNEMF